MVDTDPTPMLAYATPTGYASQLTGPARLGRLIVVPRAPDGTVDLPSRCIICNGPAERQWRRSSWYFRRGYLWWLVLSVYGFIGLGITMWISHRTVRVSAGLCRPHWIAHRWRSALGATAIVLGIALVIAGIVIDDNRSLQHSLGVGYIVGPALGFSGFVLALVGILYAGPRAALLKAIWADEDIACLSGAGLPFLESLPPVCDGAVRAAATSDPHGDHPRFEIHQQ